MRRYLGIMAALSTGLLVAVGAMWINDALESDGTMLFTSSGRMIALESGIYQYEWRSSRLTAGPPWIPDIDGVEEVLGLVHLRGSIDGTAIDYRLVVVPYWIPMVLLAVLPALWVRQEWVTMRRARRLENGLCPECGYDLRATPERCPECGWGTDDEGRSA